MPSTHTKLLYHLIFTTKNRKPIITANLQSRLHEYLGGAIRGLGGSPQGVGGVADHVHLLVALKPTHCLADFMRDLKRSSSNWMMEQAGTKNFHWQEGYAAFTVSASIKKSVQRYIEKQEQHHHTKSFREELVEFLKKSGVDYDEDYLD